MASIKSYTNFYSRLLSENVSNRVKFINVTDNVFLEKYNTIVFDSRNVCAIIEINFKYVNFPRPSDTLGERVKLDSC
jgi:hypothetical protein